MKNKKIVLLGSFVILVLILIIPMFESKPPSSVAQKAVIHIIGKALKLSHEENWPLSSDLAEITGLEIQSCPPTTKIPLTKLLIIYNPDHRSDSKDWIVIVMGGYKNFRRLVPLVLWNDYSYEKYSGASTLIEAKSNLKYYYYDY